MSSQSVNQMAAEMSKSPEVVTVQGTDYQFHQAGVAAGYAQCSAQCAKNLKDASAHYAEQLGEENAQAVTKVLAALATQLEAHAAESQKQSAKLMTDAIGAKKRIEKVMGDALGAKMDEPKPRLASSERFVIFLVIATAMATLQTAGLVALAMRHFW